MSLTRLRKQHRTRMAMTRPAARPSGRPLYRGEIEADRLRREIVDMGGEPCV